MPHLAASELGLPYLHMSPKRVSRVKGLNSVNRRHQTDFGSFHEKHFFNISNFYLGSSIYHLRCSVCFSLK